MYKYYRETEGWSDAKIAANVFERYSATSTNYSQYDPDSIMHYRIDPSFTLDGHAVGTNTELSATDKQYIRLWYPFLWDARGTLRTGNDCDEIRFEVQRGAVAKDAVEFILTRGATVTWWKSIGVPSRDDGYTSLAVWDGRDAVTTDVTTLPLNGVDRSRPISFSKSKFLGIHTQLGFTWDLLPALEGGDRVTLTWLSDRCR